VVKKALLSLLISTVLVGGFAALAFTGLSNLIEARFYNPSVAASMTADITRNAQAIDALFAETQARFFATLSNPAVRRSFLVSQSADDIFERTQIYGLLTESIPGIQWIRFVDLDGVRLHFSTLPLDIIRQNQFSTVYRTFNESHLLTRTLASGNKALFTFDEDENRIVFAFPFFDSFDVHRGTALFSLSAPSLVALLAAERGISAADVTLVANPPGFLFGAPVTARKAAIPHVSFVWNERPLDPVRLTSPESGQGWILLSVHSLSGFFFGRIVSDTVFGFNRNMEILLLAVFFTTVYLTVFFLFNVKPSPAAVIQNRQKELQMSLLEQFYESAETCSDNEGELDWGRLRNELRLRRDEINAHLKRDITLMSESTVKDIDAFIERAWNELSAIIDNYERSNHPVDEQKLTAILDRILTAVSRGTIPPLINTSDNEIIPSDEIIAINDGDEYANDGSDEMETLAKALKADEEIEELEELDELEDLEELEEHDEAEEQESEMTKEIAEPEELDEFDEAEAVGETKIPKYSHFDMLDVSSSIELTPILEPYSPPAASFNWDSFEVSSPFSNHDTREREQGLSDLLPEGENIEDLSLEELEEVNNRTLASASIRQVNFSLSSKPFSQTRHSSLETLEAVTDKPADIPTDNNPIDIIEECSGIYYINGETTKDAAPSELNHDFKTLVDSVVSTPKGKL